MLLLELLRSTPPRPSLRAQLHRPLLARVMNLELLTTKGRGVIVGLGAGIRDGIVASLTIARIERVLAELDKILARRHEQALRNDSKVKRHARLVAVVADCVVPAAIALRWGGLRSSDICELPKEALGKQSSRQGQQASQPGARPAGRATSKANQAQSGRGD